MARRSVLIMKNYTFLSNDGDGVQTIMNLKSHSQPYCFIIPEYMNKRIVEKGTQKQKEGAWRNLVLTEQAQGKKTSYRTAIFNVCSFG